MARELTPLDQLTALTPTQRQTLARYWITSIEEFFSTAQAGNSQYGSGRGALAVVLGISPNDMRTLLDAAKPLLPRDLSFSVPVEREVGAGLVLDGYVDPDIGAFSVPTNLPEKVEPLFALPTPHNQGIRNSCVAFTLAAAYQILSRDATDLSEQFLYWASKTRDGIAGDVGTNPLKAAEALRDAGICTEATWPYAQAPRDDQNPGHGPPPAQAMNEALLRRIERIEPLAAKGIGSIKEALAAGKPVLIGLMIYEHWQSSWQGSVRGRLRRHLPGESTHGGHAMLALGYRDDVQVPGGGYFIVRNSWGPSWAKDNPDGPGLCHIPYRLISEQGLAAIALSGVAPPPALPPPAPLGANTSVTLDELIGEAQELKLRVDEIGLRVNDLLLGLRQLRGDPVTTTASLGAVEASPAAPVASNAGVEAEVGPQVVLMPPGEGDDFRDLAPNGLSPSGLPLLRINAAAVAQRLGQQDEVEPRERLAIYRAKRIASTTGKMGTVADINPNKLDEARWALVINAREDSALIKALWPLVEHRMRQMGLTPPVVSFQVGENAASWMSRHSDGFKHNLRDAWGKIPPVLIYRHGDDGPERVGTWLSRHGIENGPVDPRRGVPFYLLVVGRPGPLNATDRTAISFNFQYELDMFWAVGRVCFTDERGQHRIADYRNFAERLVAVEARAAKDAAERLRKELVLFATRHEDDLSTERSADELAGSLAAWHGNPQNLPTRTGFGLAQRIGADATRPNFVESLTATGKPPALFFAACHGMGLPLDDSRLVAHQGALVLQEWSGQGNVRREHWFAGEDLATLAPNLEGSAALMFACYGGGCPTRDEFLFEPGRTRTEIAPFALVAQLPQQMLLAGAIGVIAHVERAWTFSFSGLDGATRQSQAFEDVLGRLMQGRRLGDALDQFDAIRGARSLTLTEAIENSEFGQRVSNFELARLWMARNDARNYTLIGDPAARLPYESTPE